MNRSILKVAATQKNLFSDTDIHDFIISTTNDAQSILLGTSHNKNSALKIGGVNDDIVISKVLTVNSNVNVTGDLNVTSNLDVWGAATFGSNMYIQSNLDVSGSTHIHGDLIVDGTQTTMNTDVKVTDQFIVVNNGTGPALVVNQIGDRPIAQFKDDSNVVITIADNGLLGLGTEIPQEVLHVVGNAIIESNVLIDNTLTVTNDAVLNNNVNVANILNVVGETVLNSNLRVTGDTVDIDGVLNVTGETFLNSNLHVTSNVNIGESLNVVGVSTLESNVDIGGMLNVSETLNVDGITTLQSNVGIGTSAPSFELHVVGDIFTTGSLTQSSDARLKTNIRYLVQSLDRVTKLQGCTFNRKDGQITDTKDHIGFIAQELIKVIPEVVEHDGVSDLYSVNYATMVALLTEAIKELNTKHHELLKRVEILELNHV